LAEPHVELVPRQVQRPPQELRQPDKAVHRVLLRQVALEARVVEEEVSSHSMFRRMAR
jgi:hypothetical protein